MAIRDIYTDGIHYIYVTGNLVRMELASLQPHHLDEENNPIVQVTHRLLMPLDSFVNAYAVQHNIIQQLMETGIISQEFLDEKINAPAQPPEE